MTSKHACSLPAARAILLVPTCTRSNLAAWAEKEGGGTSFFGRKTWKKRFFAVSYEAKTIAYFETEAAANAAAPKPLKPALNLFNYKVSHPAGATGGQWEVRCCRRLMVAPFGRARCHTWGLCVDVIRRLSEHINGQFPC